MAHHKNSIVELLAKELYTDASADGVDIPGARRAGWAVVAMDSEGRMIWALYGAISVDHPQT